MSKLAKNILYNLAGQAALTVLGLVAVRFVFRGLGADAFGIVLFATAAGTLSAGLMDLGLSATVVREISAHWTDQREYAVALFRTAAALAWAGWALLVALLWLGAPLVVTHWMNLQTISPHQAAGLVQVTMAGAFLSLPRSIYVALFRGLQRMAVLNAIEVAWPAVQQVGMAVIVLVGGGVAAACGWFALSYGIGLAAFLLLSALLLSPRMALPALSVSALKRNLGFSSMMMSSSAFGAVMGQADRLMVSKLMAVGTLGYYGFAASVASVLGRVAYAVVLAAFPAFAAGHRGGGASGLRAEYGRVQPLVLALAAPGFAALVFIAQPVFGWIFGSAVGSLLVGPAIVLSLGWYLNAAVSAGYFASLAAGRPDISAKQNLFALLLVLPIGLGMTWRFGLVGAASTWLLYHLFALVYGIPRICRECLLQPAWSWYRQLLLMLVVIGATYGCGFAVATLAAGGALGWLLVSYLVASAAYIAVTLRLISPELRALAFPPGERIAA